MSDSFDMMSSQRLPRLQSQMSLRGFVLHQGCRECCPKRIGRVWRKAAKIASPPAVKTGLRRSLKWDGEILRRPALQVDAQSALQTSEGLAGPLSRTSQTRQR